MTPEEGIRRIDQLATERQNWASYWEEIARYCLPRKSHIIGNNTGLDSQRNFHQIYDNTAIMASKTMAAGFHSHLTNPSSKWFEMQTKNKALMENKDVKVWFNDVDHEMFSTLSTSNFYAIIQEFYLDAGVFGTGAIFEEEDTKSKVRFTMLPLGEIYIEEDAHGRVTRIFRKFEYTVQQAYDRWGNKAGEIVRKAMEEKTYDKKIQIVHWIVPREVRDRGKADNVNMEFESKWVEVVKKELIHESGYQEFPVAVGRFLKETGERWGFSPAMDNMPDIRMINAMKKVVIRASMKVVDPPISVPSKGFHLPLNMNPNGINYRHAQVSADDLKPIETRGNIPVGLEMIEYIKASIEEGFFVPLFKAFSQITKQMTIPEVQRRISENMALLGPVVGRFTTEVLDTLLLRTFSILYRNGHFPDPPEALLNQELDVMYISQLAKAQRGSEIQSLERSMMTIGEIGKFIPTVLQKVNADKAADMIVEINGTDPELLFDEEEVAAIRQAEMEAMEAQQKADQMSQTADTVEKVSKAEKNLQPAGGAK